MSLRDHYDAHILPHLIEMAMRAPMATREREVLIPQAGGEVLEIGAGSGLNLSHYTNRVTRLHVLEPNDKLRAKAQARARNLPFDVRFIALSGEAIPLADESVDQVVCTWVLCSIPDVQAALGEMYRVLKPGGQLLFIEHGRAPKPKLAAWQDRLTPIWGCCAGGCHLNRRPDLLIGQAGFDLESLEQGFLDGPKLLTYHYKGVARRP